MLNGYVVFPGRYKQDVEPLFETIRESRYNYPEFMQKRGGKHSTDYTVTGTITANKVLDLVNMFLVLDKVLDDGIFYHVAFAND